MQRILLILCTIFTIFGCGADETTPPTEHIPDYFPNAIGSRWVYQGSDGRQSTRAVTDEAEVEGKHYRVFNDTPPPPDDTLDLVTPIYTRITPNRVFSRVDEKINAHIQTQFPKAVQDEFAGLELTVTAEPTSFPELLLLHIPLTATHRWNAFDVEISGNIVLQDLVLLQIPFSMSINVEAEVLAAGPVETPAGNFAETYQIEYRTEITQTLFSAVETTEKKKRVWFAPHVGIVKIEDEHGVKTLIAY